ncbi:immunity 53 family protein [Ancylobacter terrae]|uniref:immunity 53 family protein n=1 Tax=Ancylobacter sp. sgz301288 TaxID=3342077 RepID=UPI00385AE83B
MSQPDALDWLMAWYRSNCDGDWEHSFGVKITTLDNPGWSVAIDLTGTGVDGLHFPSRQHNYEHEADWWLCRTEDNKFIGVGGPMHLGSIIEVFRSWVLSTAH